MCFHVIYTLYVSNSRPVASPSAQPTTGGPAIHLEPSVDFELDVKVDIDSGRCVLHPKEPKEEGTSSSDIKG